MSSVCQDQNTFNVSVRDALKYVRKQDLPKKSAQLIMLGIWVLAILWALLLASRVRDVEGRKMHFVLAMAFPPVYILSYYLGTM